MTDPAGPLAQRGDRVPAGQQQVPGVERQVDVRMGKKGLDLAGRLDVGAHVVVEGRFEPGGADAGRGGVDVAGEADPALLVQAQTVFAAARVRTPGLGPGVGERRQWRAGRVDDHPVHEHVEGGVERGKRCGEGIVVGERQVDPAAGQGQTMAAQPLTQRLALSHPSHGPEVHPVVSGVVESAQDLVGFRPWPVRGELEHAEADRSPRDASHRSPGFVLTTVRNVSLPWRSTSATGYRCRRCWGARYARFLEHSSAPRRGHRRPPVRKSCRRIWSSPCRHQVMPQDAPSGLETRPISAEEFPAFFKVLVEAFGDEFRDDECEVEALVFEPERSLAVFDEDAIVGTTAIFSRELTVPGAVIPVAAVTMVCVAPTHRRRGLLTSLMRRQLTELHENEGEPVAALWASEAAIYGRFGYGPAARGARLTARTPRLRMRPGTDRGTGRVRRVELDQARADLVAVYEQLRPDHRRMAQPERFMVGLPALGSGAPSSRRHGATGRGVRGARRARHRVRRLQHQERLGHVRAEQRGESP